MSVRKPAPPTFDEARNRRQKVRAAGLDPNHWYAVEHDSALAQGSAVEVTFWGESVALWRDAEGALHAIDDRCCHRQLRLSQGEVRGCQLVCKYHGWAYDGSGQVVDIPHDTFGKRPSLRVREYPVRVRYGLIWIFFGDAERADSVPMPEIPELEGPDRWACVPVDFTWNAHHSMIIDNVSDFTHAYLHKKYKPFDGSSKLTKLVEDDDRVLMSYDTKVGGGKISGMFVDRKAVNTSSMDLGYEYPYQWSNTDNAIKHWCLVLPESEQRTRVFFLFYFKSFKVPMTPLRIPRWLMTPFLKVSNELLVKPLLAEDGWAVEEEQEGWRRHWDAPIAELNPAVHAMQSLTIRKWEEYLATRHTDGRRRHLSAEG